MCSSLGRRRGFESAAEVPVRSDIRVEAHVGFPRDHLCRMEHAIRTATQGKCQSEAQLLRQGDFWASNGNNLFFVRGDT